MKNTKIRRFLGIMGLIFSLAIIYSLIINFPDYKSYEVGFTSGYILGLTLKFLGAVGLIVYGISSLKMKGTPKI